MKKIVRLLPLLILPVFAFAADDDTTTPNTTGWGGGAEFNTSISKGNTDIETLGASAEIDYKAMPLNTSLKGNYMRNRTDQIERARKIGGALRTGMNIANNVDFFALGTYLQNRFSGIERQWMVTPGLGIYLVNSDMFAFRLEGGAGFMNEVYTTAPNTSASFGVGTAGVGFRLKISEVADLTDDAIWISHLSAGSDWRLNNTAAISSRMTKVLSLKIAQNTEYRHLPVYRRNPVDNLTTAAIVLKF